MAKPTTIKEAIQLWEFKTGSIASEATEVTLSLQMPPIKKMDRNLSELEKCEKLSLSSNIIEQISGLQTLRNLKILALGRNEIKSLSGLEPVSDTLEELWISYNFIEQLNGIENFKMLKVLYIAHNLVKDWDEFDRLKNVPFLDELLFVGNPLYKRLTEEKWREEASKRLTNLTKLDGEAISRD
ncbi:Dynein light chain 1 [Blattella germanica]|nr:Dynein light chain 1 [Blattella germanica]